MSRDISRALNAKYNATTRKAINNNGLAFVSDESFSKSFAGIYAIYKHVAPQSRRPSGMLARAFLGKTDHGRILEFDEVGISHANRVDVGARVELDFGLFRQGTVTINRQTEQFAEWWHGTRFRCWKLFDEFSLRCERHFRAADVPLQNFKINDVICRQHREDHSVVSLKYNCLREFCARDMFGLCDLL
jgi:hypothetical protein